MVDPHRSSNRRAFTLLELLAVVVVISILIALLVPAVNAAREAARRAECLSQLRQLTLATANHERYQGYYPASRRGRGGYSVHVQLLPYVEQLALYEQFDLDVAYDPSVAAGGSRLALRIPRVYVCPNMDKTERRRDAQGTPTDRPTSYAANCGLWFVWDPATGAGGAGAFYPESRLTPDDFADGLTNTLAFAEVLTMGACMSKVGKPGWLPVPQQPNDVPLMPGQGVASSDTDSHASWVLGQVHHTGFTLVLPQGIGADWTNAPEGSSPTVRTYAVVPPASQHTGGAVACFMDGSTRFLQEDLDAYVLRALGTRSGGEFVDREAY